MPIKVWVGLQSRLRENELREWYRHAELIDFEIVSDLSAANLVIIKDLNISSFLYLLLSRPKIPKIQFVSEPKVVWPLSYFPLLQRFFNLRVFRCMISELMGSSKKNVTSFWDPNRVLPSEKNWFPSKDRLNRAVIVNAHKFSFVRGELYSLRRRCVASDLPIDLFGGLWRDKPSSVLFQALKAMALALLSFQKLALNQNPLMISNSRRMNLGGIVGSKKETMEKYKIGLVIENSRELMSEKIWDSWNSGCIPVYVGPQLSEWDIPKDLYIQCSPNIKSIEQGLMIAMNSDHEVFLRNLSEWINSRRCRDRFGYENTVKLLYEQLEKSLNFRF